MSNQANIKALTRHLVDRVGGFQIAADICGVPKSEVSYWCSDHHTRFIPVDHLVDLDRAAKDLFLAEWANSRGYDLVKREAQTPKATECVIKAVGHLSKETGDLGFTVLDAAADNHLTPVERRRIRDDIAPVKDAIAQLERAIA